MRFYDPLTQRVLRRPVESTLDNSLENVLVKEAIQETRFTSVVTTNNDRCLGIDGQSLVYEAAIAHKVNVSKAHAARIPRPASRRRHPAPTSISDLRRIACTDTARSREAADRGYADLPAKADDLPRTPVFLEQVAGIAPQRPTQPPKRPKRRILRPALEPG